MIPSHVPQSILALMIASFGCNTSGGPPLVRANAPGDDDQDGSTIPSQPQRPSEAGAASAGAGGRSADEPEAGAKDSGGAASANVPEAGSGGSGLSARPTDAAVATDSSAPSDDAGNQGPTIREQLEETCSSPSQDCRLGESLEFSALSVTPDAGGLLPGSVVSIEARLSNTGTQPTNLCAGLVAADGAEVTASQNGDERTVACGFLDTEPGATTTVSWKVTIASSARAGDVVSLAVYAASRDDSCRCSEAPVLYDEFTVD